MTLVYFDLRGRAEAIRLLLEESGVAYRDQRINGDTWATIKNDPRLLFGQVPLLQDGDLAIVQSYVRESVCVSVAIMSCLPHTRAQACDRQAHCARQGLLRTELPRASHV